MMGRYPDDYDFEADFNEERAVDPKPKRRRTLLDWISYGCILAAAAFWLVQCAHAKDVAIGDSIAQGTGAALHVETHALKGAGSCAIIAFVPNRWFKHAVISAGINDEGACVGAVRSRMKAGVVVWILPAPINGGYAAVRAVARRYGDRTVRYRCAGPCTKSNFHPASYQVVAKWVRIKWKGGRLSSVTSAKPLATNGT